MAKKIISVVLSLVMALSFSVNVFAASSFLEGMKELSGEIKSNINTTVNSVDKIGKIAISALEKLEPTIKDFVLDSNNWEQAGKYMMDIIVKIYDNIISGGQPGEPGEPDNPDKPDEPEVPEKPSILDAIKDLTIGDFVKLIQTYFFINLDDIPETSTDIIEAADYTYVLLEDGRETVFIAVNLEEHPELLNRDLLMEATEKLYEEQKVLYPNLPEENLMSYEHIAGELALHAILYAVSNEYLKISGETEGTIYNLWERARIADLNINENRIPSEIIEIAGTYIMGVFIVDIYTIVKIFKN